MKAFAQSIMTAIVVLLLTPVLSFAQDPCECTNCPVPITDNGTFQGLLNVNVSGPNDLGACPLQQVCFTINHTWVGDLSVSLTSPSGLNYLVMADDNNNFSGCGTDADNIDVCVTVGTGNPLTNNGPYVCNNGNPCLNGNWTMPCGGVTDPVSGAVQSPNCNLNDFNIPGSPANGTWTLTVNDICNADVGFLQTWSLVFACGTNNCITCEPEGGALNTPDVVGCLGDPGLDLSISPVYIPPNIAPDPAEYSYTYVISQAGNGTIISFQEGPDLSTLPPGDYQICGLSYVTDEAGQLIFYLGSTLAQLQSDLNSGAAPFCGDLSDDCFNATVGPPIPPTILDTLICLGECYVAPDGTQCCTPGPCQYTLPSYLGCDSLIIMNVLPAPVDFITETEILCFDDCVTIDGDDYCAPGNYTLEFTNQFGCDSIIILNLIGIPVSAVVLEPDTLTCSNTAINLDGSTSAATSYSWIDPSGTEIGTAPFQIVNTPGCYDLIVGNTLSGITCFDTTTVCVAADLDVPDPPTIMGETFVCGNEIITYTLTPDPLADAYTWTFPADATVIDGGDGFLFITIDWTGSMGGAVCATGQNGCGAGPTGCTDVSLIAVPAEPTVTGLDVVCAGDTETYQIVDDPIISTINWTVPAGATILSGQGTTQIEVLWGSNGGDVCIVVGNNCGDLDPVCLPVTVEDVPVEPTVVGPSPVCPGVELTYILTLDPDATGYTWTVPACATIVSGQGTNALSVLFDTSCATADICVTADNNCGSSAQNCFTVTIDPLATDPTISGPDPVCINDNTSYSASVITGAVDYTWIVTGGAITAGQGSANIDVQWTTGGLGQVCVVASTACSSSAQICQDVQVNEPATQPVIDGPAVVCDGSVVDYTVTLDPNATAYNWSLSCGTIVAGQNTNTITVDWTGCPTGGDVCIILDSNCGSTTQVCLPVQGGTIPQDPQVSGPNTSCLSSMETYCATTDPNISNYNWVVINGTIVNGQGTECVEVIWDAAGNQQICVTAENACGPANQVCYDVEVEDVPPASAITGDNLVCNGDNSSLEATNIDPTVTSYNWTVTGTCGTITAGQGTSQVSIDWIEAGVCEVCVEAVNVCGAGAITCYEVTVVAIPSPDAGADDGICGLEYTLNGQLTVGTGTWTVVGSGNVMFDDVTDPNTTVTADTYGDYTFTWTIDDLGCVNSDEVTISFNDDPVISGIIVEACSPSELDYTVTFDVIGGDMPYTISGLTAGTFAGNTFTSELILSGTPYQIEIFDANGCGPLLIEGQETCDCITDAGTMATDTLQACVDGTVTAVAPADALFDMDDIDVFILHEDNGTSGSTLGAILDQYFTGTFGMTGTMIPGVIYYISYVLGNDDGTGTVDLGDDCTDVSLGQPIIFYDYPSPDAGTDQAVCALMTTLAAIDNGFPGTWTQTTGPGTASFVDASASGSEVTVDQYGTYTFTWTEDNNGCIASADITVVFNDDPVVSGPVTEVCDLINFTYTVSFQITGGTAPYTVTGSVTGTVAGDIFTSDPIPSGDAYNFEVSDAASCGPAIVAGQVTCQCATDAGTMSTDLVSVCEDATAVVDPTAGTTLDPEDILLYVIHNGAANSLGTEVYAYNDVPEFGLIPPMTTGVTYYISAIAGNDFDGDLEIDANDPCVSVAVGTPVIFTALPVVSLLEDVTVCENETATLTLNIDAETCVDITLTVSDGTMQNLLCVEDGDTFTVNTMDQDLTVTITSVADQNTCNGTAGATATITVNTIPEATVGPGTNICNSTDSGNTTLLDFGTLITGGDTGGTWENTDNIPTSGNFPVLDFTGVNPGTYTFTYTTNSALAPCPEAVYTTSIVVEDCVCPSVALLPPDDLCNNAGQLDLNDLVLSTENGTWAIISTPGGVNPATLNGSLLNAANADIGSYTLEWTLAVTPPVGCPTSGTVSLDVQESLTAGTAGATLEYCLGETITVDLVSQLTGADLGGVWTEESTTPSTGGAFNSATGTFNINNQVPGTYTFRYTVSPNAPCLEDATDVLVVINGLPGADAGPDLLLTCAEPFMELGGTMASGSDLAFLWTSATGAFPGDSTEMQPFVTEPGTFTLTVTNLATGCSDSDVVVVTAALDAPIPAFSLLPVSCFGDADGAIIIDSVLGGAAPYVYSLNGEPFTSTPAFLGLEASSYTLVVEDLNGCQNEIITIDISQPQELVVDLVAFVNAEDNVVTLGDSVSLNALVTLPEDLIDSVQWSPAELVTCDTCLNTMATPLETTSFSVTVSSNGCADSDNLNLLVRKNLEIYVPNGFSPDGDGVNDLFYPFAGPQVESIESFLVFNRWGETVYQYYQFLPNDPAFGWDGTHRGKLLDNAVFTWFAEVKLIDGRIEIFKGDVALLR